MALRPSAFMRTQPQMEGFETNAGAFALVWAKALPPAQAAMQAPMTKAPIRRTLPAQAAPMISANNGIILLLPAGLSPIPGCYSDRILHRFKCDRMLHRLQRRPDPH